MKAPFPLAYAEAEHTTKSDHAMTSRQPYSTCNACNSAGSNERIQEQNYKVVVSYGLNMAQRYQMIVIPSNGDV